MKKQRMRTTKRIQQRACELRQRMTPAEKLLWEQLRRTGRKGRKFRRQHPVGRFIADFYCAESGLLIELDGGIHDTQQRRDQERSAYLEQRGYRVLRFRNEQVLYELENVLAAIEQACQQHTSTRILVTGIEEDTPPVKRRTPPASIAGKAPILGDMLSPIVNEEEWECLK